jgi:hypothetical protein
MIFGQPQRIAFQHPSSAGYYTPGTPNVGFYSNFHPFPGMFPRMQAVRAQIPPPQADMAPGVASRVNPSAGGFGHAFGHSFGNFGRNNGSGSVNPYRVMRSGGIPGVMSSGGDIRRGVTSAGQLIRRLSPGAFSQQNIPAGPGGG